MSQAESPSEVPPEVPSEVPSEPAVEAGRQGDGSLALGSWLLAMVWLGAGVALRLWLSARSTGLEEWEAPWAVRAWEPGAGWNRFLPAGLEGVWSWICGMHRPETLRDLRHLGIALSVAGLVAAWILAGAVSTATGLGGRRLGRALAWTGFVWAVHPTLMFSSVRADPGAVVGIGACLALAGVALYARRRGPVGWLFMTLGLSVLAVVGGIVVAVPLVLATLVFLAPVPGIRTALPVVLAVVLAAGAGWWVQRGPDADRPWLPDTAPAHGASGLLGLPPPLAAAIPVDPDRRARDAYLQVRAAVSLSEPVRLVVIGMDRLLVDRLGPVRFEGGSWPPWVAVLLDLFVRGGLLFFAVAVLVLVPRSEASSWPRAGVVAGLLSWGLLLALVGLGPHALGPWDLTVLGIAGAGAATSRPGRSRTRRAAFTVGGLMMCTLAVAPATSDKVGSGVLRTLGHHGAPGLELVQRLAGGGPPTTEGQVDLTERFMRWDTPSLRLPEAALRHALLATEKDPSSNDASAAVLRALVENLRLDEAEAFADQWRSDDPEWSQRIEAMRGWVLSQKQKMRMQAPR